MEAEVIPKDEVMEVEFRARDEEAKVEAQAGGDVRCFKTLDVETA